jgi:hypothetical protein
VKLAMGRDKGEANAVFDQLDDAINRTMEINQTQFDKEITNAFNDLDGMYWRAPAVFVAVLLLTIVGVGIRLRLYTSV